MVEKLRFDFANIFLVLIVINILLHYIIPIKQIIYYPYLLLGVVLFILGWIPNMWVGIYFRKIGTSIPAGDLPKTLITSGLFKISRNPVYLGMIVTLFGEAIFLGSMITFIIPVIFFILIHTNIQFEEKMLGRKFGKKYLEYKKKVRRWV